MIAYKFLARGAAGPLSGWKWPEPGRWVEVEGPLELCARGVHVCRPEDLAHWLYDELWEIEAAGDQIVGIDCLVTRRARLLRRIDDWHLGGAARFAEACVQHAAAQADEGADAGPGAGEVRALIADARISARHGYPAVSAHAAALAVARLREAAEADAAYARERRWQGEWIARAVIAPAGRPPELPSP